MRSLFILRGIPGSGKSTVAAAIAGPEGVICEADAYFVGGDGVYRFDANFLSAAHAWCKNHCQDAMENQTEIIVISNTNVVPEHFKWYEDKAAEYGYRVFHLIVENRHGGTNQHGVPKHTAANMRAKLRDTIQLGLG